jgi:Coenzyme PQQ synthesis protein D (PqqD)
MLMRPAQRSGLVIRIVDGEAVVLDRPNDQVHRLNSTATCVWTHCDGSRSVEDVAAIVATTFEADHARVLADTRTVIDQLAELGLLVENEGQAR